MSKIKLYPVVLVTGGRDFNDRALFDRTLRKYLPMEVLIHGGARGADSLAGEWAIYHGVHVAQVPAMWTRYASSAGPRRNRAMMFLRPSVVIAFPGGVGTENAVDAALHAGIDVVRVS